MLQETRAIVFNLLGLVQIFYRQAWRTIRFGVKKKKTTTTKTKTALIRVCQLVRHCDQSCENVFTAIAKCVFVSLTKIRDSTNFYHTTIWWQFYSMLIILQNKILISLVENTPRTKIEKKIHRSWFEKFTGMARKDWFGDMLFISGTIKTLFFRNPAKEKAKKNILGIVKLLSDKP